MCSHHIPPARGRCPGLVQSAFSWVHLEATESEPLETGHVLTQILRHCLTHPDSWPHPPHGCSCELGGEGRFTQKCWAGLSGPSRHLPTPHQPPVSGPGRLGGRTFLPLRDLENRPSVGAHTPSPQPRSL